MFFSKSLKSLLLLLLYGFFASATNKKAGFALKMPNTRPLQDDTYLCTSINVADKSNVQKFIIGFEPQVAANHAHHMLLFGCAEPGSTDPIWKCGEMKSSQAEPEGRVCKSGRERILFAWAMDGKAFELPSDTGFMIGKDAGIENLVLQIHYKNTADFKANSDLSDNSGLFLETTETPPKNVAGIYLFITNGEIPAKSTVFLETACLFNGRVPIHPFAFRVHTHKHGKLVTAFDIHGGKWHEIGRMDPQKPQMFYPLKNKTMLIQPQDRLAARCIMHNNEDKPVFIGSTMKSEMCNFYMMYSVPYGDRAAVIGGQSGAQKNGEAKSQQDNSMCYSAGWPFYKWSAQFDVTGEPISAAQLPGPNGHTFHEHFSTAVGLDGSRRSSASGATADRQTALNGMRDTAYNWKSQSEQSADGRMSSSEFEASQNSRGMFIDGEPFEAEKSAVPTMKRRSSSDNEYNHANEEEEHDGGSDDEDDEQEEEEGDEGEEEGDPETESVYDAQNDEEEDENKKNLRDGENIDDEDEDSFTRESNSNPLDLDNSNNF